VRFAGGLRSGAAWKEATSPVYAIDGESSQLIEPMPTEYPS
jgi:hypothetical protein